MGGGGGSSVASSSKLQQADITPEAWKDLREPLAQTVGQATTGKQPLTIAGVPAYEGQYAAPATGQEMSLIDRIFGQAGQGVTQAGFDPGLNQFAGGQTALQQAGQGHILDTLSGKYLDPNSNPYLQSTIQSAIAPVSEEWKNTILPNLKLGFTQGGQTITGTGSSPFDRALALAGNKYTDTIGGIATKIAAGNYDTERNRMMTALSGGQAATGQQMQAQTSGLAAQQAQQGQNLQEQVAQMDSMTKSLQAVALPRMIEQYGLDQGTQEYRNRLDKLMNLLTLQGQLAKGIQTTPIAESGSQGISGPAIGAVGAVGAAAASAAIMM